MIFQNKTIILTGASVGIGKSLALSLAEQGANLVLAARDQGALEETVTMSVQKGGQAIAVPTDVTQPKACQQLIEHALSTFGQIDCLVNNAGITMIQDFEQVSDLSVFEQLMRVNYLGAVYCTHSALPGVKPSSKETPSMFRPGLFSLFLSPFGTESVTRFSHASLESPPHRSLPAVFPHKPLHSVIYQTG